MRRYSSRPRTTFARPAASNTFREIPLWRRTCENRGAGLYTHRASSALRERKARTRLSPVVYGAAPCSDRARTVRGGTCCTHRVSALLSSLGSKAARPSVKEQLYAVDPRNQSHAMLDADGRSSESHARCGGLCPDAGGEAAGTASGATEIPLLCETAFRGGRQTIR